MKTTLSPLSYSFHSNMPEPWVLKKEALTETGSIDHVLDPLPWLETHRVDKWMEKGNLEGLNRRIVEAAQKFFDKPDLIAIGIPKEIARKKLVPCHPPVLFSKVAKEGRVLKFALNIGQEIDVGTRVSVYKVPQVVLKKDGTFELRPKALIVHRTDETPISSIKYYEQGASIVQKAVRDSKIPVFLPRPLEKFTGCYIQHCFKKTLKKAIFEDLSGETPQPFVDKLQLFEDVARFLQRIKASGAAHHDVKPGNIVLYSDEENRNRGYLLDYNFTVKMGKKLSTFQEGYRYYDSLTQSSGLKTSRVTSATDLVGLAQTMLDSFFLPIIGQTSPRDWLQNPWEYALEEIEKCSDQMDLYLSQDEVAELYHTSVPPEESPENQVWALGRIYDLIIKIFAADQKLYHRFPDQESVDNGDPVKAADEIFGEIDAGFVADELKRIRQCIEIE